MRASSYTRGHFRSRDKYDGRVIRSAVSEKNPRTARKLHGSGLCFYRTGVRAGVSFTLREWVFWTIFAPVTLTLT